MQFVQLDFMATLFPEQKPKQPVRSKQPEVVISPSLLAHYRGLSEIAPSEWLNYFPKTGKPWTSRDLKYLADWWGKDDVMDLAFALGRPPWSLQREVCRMRREGTHIPYQRIDKPKAREKVLM